MINRWTAKKEWHVGWNPLSKRCEKDQQTKRLHVNRALTYWKCQAINGSARVRFSRMDSLLSKSTWRQWSEKKIRSRTAHSHAKRKEKDQLIKEKVVGMRSVHSQPKDPGLPNISEEIAWIQVDPLLPESSLECQLITNRINCTKKEHSQAERYGDDSVISENNM